MDVAAYLPSQLFTHLRAVLGPEHALHDAASWPELALLVRHESIDVIVADPTVDRTAEPAALEDLARAYPSVPLVLYTTLSPSAMRAVARLARSGVEHVVLNRFDDEPRRFRQLLERVPGQALGEQMLDALQPQLRLVPVGVRRAIEQLYRRPESVRSAAELAMVAGMNARTLYRNLEPAGLRSPRLLVASARLVRAYVMLRDPARSIKEVAARSGYHSAWHLTRQMKELTGLTPNRARATLEPQRLVDRLVGEVLGANDETAPVRDVVRVL